MKTKAIEKKEAKPTDVIKAKADKLLVNALAAKVAGVDDYQKGIALLIEVAKLQEQAATQRESEAWKKAKQTIATLTAQYKPILDLLDKVDETIRLKVHEWAKETDELVKAKYEALKASEKNPTAIAKKEADLWALLPPKTVALDTGTGTMRDLADFNIVDPDLIPEAYKALDLKKIRADLAADESLVIPGVERTSKKSISIKPL